MAPLPTGTVTFLFTDIEGSTRLLQDLGDAKAKQVFIDYRRILLNAVQAVGGHLWEDQGESFLFVFQRAKDALQSAVAAQRTLTAHVWPEGATLRVRMGLHTGEPARTGDGYVGVDVHRVARICQTGHGGQILLSQTTRSLTMHDPQVNVGLRDLGAHRLKDLQRSERIFQLIHPDLPVDFPPLRTLDILPNNLPRQLTSFVGREREMADVKRVLSTTHLLTLTGTGGCGKTRFAIQVAADLVDTFRDGVWLVELAALSDPALVPQVVASTLSVREQHGRPLLATLIDYLQARELLLVLDNCEHLIAACAHLAEALLRACPALRIVATSQESIRIAGETVWPVPPLTLPDLQHLPALEHFDQYAAVRLFADRAAVVVPGFRITEANAPWVAQVCARLDGLPLAIELAAARVKILPVQQIAARLDDRFRLLTGGSRTILLRHQTLRATMDWSYGLLSEKEPVLLRRFSAFAGGCALEAGEAVCGWDGIEPDDVLDVLSQLVDRSLVMVDMHGSDARYRLLETVRQYAREKLHESGEEAETCRRHRDWYVHLAERAETMLVGPGEDWLDKLERELDNLRAALDLSLRAGDVDAGLRLAGALRRFWHIRGYWTEGRKWLEAFLAISQDADPVLRAKGLMSAGSLAQHQGDYERAKVLSEESSAIQRTLGDKRGLAASLNVLGNVLYEQGNYRASWQVHEESLVYGREAGDQHAMAGSLINLATLALHEGDYERAAALCQESLALFREVGDKRGIAFALNLLGVMASDRGDYLTARTRFEESLGIRRELRERRGIAGSLTSLGLVAREQGDHASARAYYQESLAIQQELGDKRGIAGSLYNLGLVAWRQGDATRATALFAESLRMRKMQGNKPGVAACLEGLARVAGLPERAARLLGSAAALRESTGASLSPSDRADYDRQLSALKIILGEAAFSGAWNQGRTIPFEQVVQDALAAEVPQPPSSF